MKKLAGLATTASLFLVTAASTFAQVDITPGTPSQGINPKTEAWVVITNILTIVFVVAIVLVLFFLILGAFKWITSGGDKEGVKGARETIINALIGLAVLALAFVIANIAGKIVNVDFQHLVLPRLDQPTSR